MKLTSVYNPTQTFLVALPSILLVSLPFVGMPIGILLSSSSKTVSIVIALAVLLLVIAVATFMHLKKRNYAQTFYELDDEKVIYFDGFFSPTRKEVLYKRILEADLKQGFIQKQFGLGTITLVTNSASSNQPAAGISIRDIENSDEVYEAVKKIVYPHIKNS